MLNGGDNPDDPNEKCEEWLEYENLLINVGKKANGKHYAIFKDKEVLDINGGQPMQIDIEIL